MSREPTRMPPTARTVARGVIARAVAYIDGDRKSDKDALAFADRVLDALDRRRVVLTLRAATERKGPE